MHVDSDDQSALRNDCAVGSLVRLIVYAKVLFWRSKLDPEDLQIHLQVFLLFVFFDPFLCQFLYGAGRRSPIVFAIKAIQILCQLARMQNCVNWMKQEQKNETYNDVGDKDVFRWGYWSSTTKERLTSLHFFLPKKASALSLPESSVCRRWCEKKIYWMPSPPFRPMLLLSALSV